MKPKECKEEIKPEATRLRKTVTLSELSEKPNIECGGSLKTSTFDGLWKGLPDGKPKGLITLKRLEGPSYFDELSPIREGLFCNLNTYKDFVDKWFKDKKK